MTDYLGWLVLALVGVIVVVGLVVGTVLLIGLFSARSLIRREIAAYFLSPIAYVVMFVFLLITATFFMMAVWGLTASGPRGVEFPMQTIFNPGSDTLSAVVHGLFWLVFLFIPPLLTMRLFAEERASGTLEVLMTAPLRDWQVVLGKYLACFTFYVFLWVPTLLYLPVLLDLRAPVVEPVFTLWSVTLLAGLVLIVAAIVLALIPLGTPMRIVSLLLLVLGGLAAGVGGRMHYLGFQCAACGIDWPADPVHLLQIEAGIDPNPVLSSYLGLLLAGGMFLAIGLLVSSLVRSQMVSALLSLLLSLVFVFGLVFAWFELDTGSTLYQALYYFSVPLHFQRDFSRGLVDTRPLVLYTSVTLFCLFLTVRSLESRRWR